MSCQDDANTVGPVSLFLGVETANWTQQQFKDAASFAAQHKIQTLFVKVAEVGSAAGDIWYGGIDTFDKNVYQPLKAAGVNVLTYQYSYGPQSANFSRDIDIAVQFLQKYQVHMLDLEGQTWEGSTGADTATKLAQALLPIPGKLWLSYPADFASNNQSGFIQAISPAVNVWCPMCYSDALMNVYKKQISVVNPQACLQPTLDLSQEFGANDVLRNAQQLKTDGCLAISLWEYQFAVTNASLVDQIVGVFATTEGTKNPVELNKNGAVLDIVQSNQLIENEPDLCGPWSVAALRVAGLPNQGTRGNAEDIDSWADSEVAKLGYNDPAQFPGVSIDDMHRLLTDALDPQSKQRNLHWWDINPDINAIRIALKAGYPVLVTANEQNIIDKKSGGRPYPWNLNANHVFPLVGVDKDGDFICADQLNNAFQGYWPPVYIASRLQPSWASVVQVVGPDPTKPWLQTVPSGDPGTWPQGFNAQQFAQAPTPQPGPTSTDYVQQAADTLWDSQVQAPKGTAIYNAWLFDYKKGVFHGPPLGLEYHTPEWGTGKQLIAQNFAGGCYTFDGSCHWYPNK